MGSLATDIRPPVGEAGTREKESAHQYLTFTVSGQVYGIGILTIKEIIQYGGVCGVPMLPAFIRGVINLRGAVVPVVDLSVRFHGQVAPTGKRNCIVIVETRADEGVQDVGVVVDSVSAVLDIAAAEIEPAPVFGARIKTDFIRGMGKVDGRFVILLDVERVLGTEGLVAVVRATQAASGP
ncbi:chemotaxis protein CheW [Thiocystis violascens]|uniref:Chemotaxis signal transduction protein n=1 Tax=Thiocystis violascens (strain ATCC 17096 / DSM 198 / 6111) TaxID=765911 RepID=I3YG21_THIV6|nr:chemotaxis protein CheW [Thiocystis violascens]AFL75939.1 chemotaxis signal transduction protein [Thiocystis violascens DSM 198]